MRTLVISDVDGDGLTPDPDISVHPIAADHSALYRRLSGSGPAAALIECTDQQLATIEAAGCVVVWVSGSAAKARAAAARGPGDRPDAAAVGTMISSLARLGVATGQRLAVLVRTDRSRLAIGWDLVKELS